MKSTIYLLFTTVILCCLQVCAQVPQGIPYQAVARNAGGAILAGQTIKVRFTIHDATATGTIVYQETFNPTTNSLGLFNVNVGTGTVISGTFSAINWGVNAKYMQVEMDPTGGTTFTDMGTQQMMSVPYALYAGSAELSGSKHLLTTQNIATTNAYAIDSNIINSKYNTYEVELSNITWSGTSSPLFMRVSTNNGSSYLTSSYDGSMMYKIMSHFNHAEMTPGRIEFAPSSISLDLTSSNSAAYINFTLANTNSNKHKVFSGKSIYHVSHPGVALVDLAAVILTTAPINGLIIQQPSGGSFSGTIKVYGID